MLEIQTLKLLLKKRFAKEKYPINKIEVTRTINTSYERYGFLKLRKREVLEEVWMITVIKRMHNGHISRLARAQLYVNNELMKHPAHEVVIALSSAFKQKFKNIKNSNESY